MPSYRHDNLNYLLERAKPQNFGGITPPSSTHIANRVSLPYDPQEASTPGSANAIELLFSQSGESFGNSPELEALEYLNINANDDDDGINVLGLLRNFIQDETTSFEDHRVHDIIVDESIADRDMYMVWTCYDSIASKYKIMLSKFAKDGTHVATQEIASHETYDWGNKVVGGAYSQRPKKTVQVSYEPLAGGAICVAFIQETGVTHSPAFPSAGTGSGVMILRKKKTDLTDMAADPIVEIMPPSATDTMLEVDIMYEVGSSIIHCALIRQTAGFVDSLWHGEYAVGAAAAPTVATSKLALGSGLDRLGQPTLVEDAVAAVYIFYGQYLNGTSEMAIKHIDHATFGTIITWHNHALSYSNIVPFAVLPINLAAGFAVAWGEDDGTSTDIVYKLKTGNASGAGGGTQTLYTRSSITEAGPIHGVYEDAGDAVFSVARYSTRERPCYIVAREVVIAATPVTSYRWRQPADAGLPVGEHFPICYNDHADSSKLFVAGSTYNGSNGEVYLGSCSFAAVFMRMRCGTSWLSTMDKLFFVASAGSQLEFGDEDLEDGCVLTVYDDVGSVWVHGNSRRAKNNANSRFGEIGGSIHMDLPGSILQGGPPEEAVFVVHANSCGELYDPTIMRLGYAALMPDPSEETIIGTGPIALGTQPPNAIFHSTVERYREDLEVAEWENGVWARSAMRFAVVHTSAAIAELDGSDEISSSVAPYIHGENIVTLRGCACDPQTGHYYIIGETNQTGGLSFVGRLIPQSGEIIKLFNLTELYNDITFHTDGRLFGVVDSTSPQQGDVNEINLNTGVELNLMNGNFGSGQSLAFNPDDGLLYHVSQSPPIFESIHPDTGASAPIAVVGAPVPAPTVAGFLVYEGSNQFSLQTDLGGNNNWYSLDVGGAIAFVGSKGAGYYGVADERTELQKTDLVGVSDNIQIAGCFFSPSHERMRLMFMQLHLARTGTVSDAHKVSIVRLYVGENGGSELPAVDDVIWEGDVQFDGVDPAPAGGWFDIEITDGAELHPGVAYAVIISRGEKQASCYGVTGGATPVLQRVSRKGANFVKLGSIDLTNDFAETFTGTVAFAIDPTTGFKYVIGTTAESPEQFLGIINPDGYVSFVARLTGFTVDDMAFDSGGQAYVVMGDASVTQANGFAPINKGTGAIGGNLVTCSAQTKHALAWHSAQTFYTINTDADVFEVVDAGAPSITPIAQTSAPASLDPNAMFWNDEEDTLIVYGDGIRRYLDITGNWTALESKHEDIEAILTGIDRDTDGSAGADDPANYISWSKADFFYDSQESTHASYLKDPNGWRSNVNNMAMRLYGEVANEVEVEVSRDNGVTWEAFAHEVFGRRGLSTWNNVDLQEQQLYGSHTFENAATGTELRIRYRVRGIYFNLKSISYFGK